MYALSLLSTTDILSHFNFVFYLLQLVHLLFSPWTMKMDSLRVPPPHLFPGVRRHNVRPQRPPCPPRPSSACRRRWLWSGWVCRPEAGRAPTSAGAAAWSSPPRPGSPWWTCGERRTSRWDTDGQEENLYQHERCRGDGHGGGRQHPVKLFVNSDRFGIRRTLLQKHVERSRRSLKLSLSDEI